MRYLTLLAVTIFSEVSFIFLKSAKGQNENPWNRSALIYHNDSRNGNMWKRHLVRITENGDFTDKWLFDHAILTNFSYMDDVENENRLKRLFDNLVQDAKDLDSALRSLPRRNIRLKLSFGCPYVANTNRRITLDGKDYNPSKREERLGILKWYIKKVNDFRTSNNLQRSEVHGVYYHKEDAIEVKDDISLITGFNNYVHELGMKSVWIPYYNAPNAFQGKSKLGFDVVIVQPNYSFLTPTYGSSVKGDRLYGMGYASAALKQCYAYEISKNAGVSTIEYLVAHQYLAIAQFTGASNFPQAFFIGGEEDLLDKATNKQEVESRGSGTGWKTYTDLADYLEGKEVFNMEAGLYLNRKNIKRVDQIDTWETSWTVTNFYSGLSSVRLDFKDPCGGYWTGSVVVDYETPDGTTGSVFSHRSGVDTFLPSYNAVYVPLADRNITEGTKLKITIEKDRKSMWPNVHRLIAAKYEPLYIANPLFEEISTSSRSYTPGPYQDNKDSHKGYERGKLTDGKLSQGNDCCWNGVPVGWYVGQFSVSIDLERVTSVSKINVWTHHDEPSGANEPVHLVGLASASCVPYLTGTTEFNCFPDVMTAKPNITIPNYPTSRLISLPFLETVRVRYVTLSATLIGSWALIDEIQVIDDNNQVVSTDRPYKVNPMPGRLEITEANPYLDDARRLVDGAVMSEWVYGYAFDGLRGGYVQALFAPKQAKFAIVWISKPDTQSGVITPSSVNIQWRNTSNVWSQNNNVTPLSEQECGPSPCAKLKLPSRTVINGIKATFPSVDGWYMISEISIL